MDAGETYIVPVMGTHPLTQVVLTFLATLQQSLDPRMKRPVKLGRCTF
jgi:hypothetical protein